MLHFERNKILFHPLSFWKKNNITCICRSECKICEKYFTERDLRSRSSTCTTRLRTSSSWFDWWQNYQQQVCNTFLSGSYIKKHCKARTDLFPLLITVVLNGICVGFLPGGIVTSFDVRSYRPLTSMPGHVDVVMVFEVQLISACSDAPKENKASSSEEDCSFFIAL